MNVKRKDSDAPIDGHYMIIGVRASGVRGPNLPTSPVARSFSTRLKDLDARLVSSRIDIDLKALQVKSFRMPLVDTSRHLARG